VTLRYLLDTNVLSVPFKNPDHPVVNRLSEALSECAIGAPVWNELRYGASLLARGKKRNALEAYLQDVVLASYSVLPYDHAASGWHGHERARLERKGSPPAFADGMIAAIAHVNDLVVVTHNTKHFKVFDGLTVEDWIGPR
jgi:tRNA(fMet)-specific endonuclease VapC